MKQWKCTICGYIHDGSEPPDACPVCKAPETQFILVEALGPDLEERLKEAFSGESKASVRNLAFAKKAAKDGYPQIAKLFRAVAEAERVHASEYLKYMEGVIGETEDNLQIAFENEIKANAEIYPPMIKKALELGRDDVAGSFSRARDVEERHAALYKNALNAMISEQQIDYNVCRICGYVFDGEVPGECPVCRAQGDFVTKIV